MLASAPLRVQRLIKQYTTGFWPFKRSSFTAVNDISFELQQGEILGFLGPNGAGKTTTIHMLLGILTPTSGTITYLGKDFAKHRADILKKVTYASGYDKLPARLTIWDNLTIYARLYGVPAHECTKRVMHMLDFFDMAHLRDRPTGMLSAGQATRVMLAKAFIPKPDIVLLDEPTASLDPDVANDVRTFILEQRKNHGTSILFTSHNMAEVTQLCDRILMLKNGSIIADDTPEQLAASVSSARVRLVITQGLEILTRHLQQHALPYTHEAHELIITIDERTIGSFLVAIARLGVDFEQVTIDKPTLEDYFLSTITS